MTTIAKVARSSLDAYFWTLKVLLTLLMALMIVPVLLQILSRYTGIIPRYIWTEEGCPVLFRLDYHDRLDDRSAR